MRRITRRAVLGFAGGTVALLGVGGIALPSLRARIRDELDTLFGPEIARSPAGRDFVEQYAAYATRQFAARNDTEGAVVRASLETLGAPAGHFVVNNAYRLAGLDDDLDSRLRREVLEKFLTSTNFAAVDGDPAQLDMIAIFDSYETPCLNQLSRRA